VEAGASEAEDKIPPIGESALDRPALLFTDERGRVVLMEDLLARALGFANPDGALGEGLGSVLGLANDVATEFLKEIAAKGKVGYRSIQAQHRPSGNLLPFLISGTADFGGGRYIGADITMTPPSFSLPTGYFDHRANLERMADMVRARLQSGSASLISGERELELWTYFAARMLAIYVLLTRMGGGAVAQALEDRIGRLAQDRKWGVEMHAGRIEMRQAGIRPEDLGELMKQALEYAVKVTSLRLVNKELAELDAGLDAGTLSLATSIGMRDQG
jgi:hypothetical protein